MSNTMYGFTGVVARLASDLTAPNTGADTMIGFTEEIPQLTTKSLKNKYFHVTTPTDHNPRFIAGPTGLYKLFGAIIGETNREINVSLGYQKWSYHPEETDSTRQYTKDTAKPIFMDFTSVSANEKFSLHINKLFLMNEDDYICLYIKYPTVPTSSSNPAPDSGTSVKIQKVETEIAFQRF